MDAFVSCPALSRRSAICFHAPSSTVTSAGQVPSTGMPRLGPVRTPSRASNSTAGAEQPGTSSRPWAGAVGAFITLPRTRHYKKPRSQPRSARLACPKRHVPCTSVQRPLHRNAPRKTRTPRSERFCLGFLGGAGGTRTHFSDASHLQRCRRNGHFYLFPSGYILLDPTPSRAVRRSPHRLLGVPHFYRTREAQEGSPG